MKIRNEKKLARLKFAMPKPIPVCPNFGQRSRHFVHPHHGDPGFFICEAPKTP